MYKICMAAGPEDQGWRSNCMVISWNGFVLTDWSTVLVESTIRRLEPVITIKKSNGVWENWLYKQKLLTFVTCPPSLLFFSLRCKWSQEKTHIKECSPSEDCLVWMYLVNGIRLILLKYRNSDSELSHWIISSCQWGNKSANVPQMDITVF